MAAKRKEEMVAVWNSIQLFGFDVAFKIKDFKDIDNTTFHRLRQSYLKAQERLEHYIEKRLPRENKQ
jgi:hypothetical protein